MSMAKRAEIDKRAGLEVSGPPLPMRDGVAASRVYLPPGTWATVFDFLVERFRFMAPEVLRSRLDLGGIVDEAGVPQRSETPYRPRQWLWYYREVPNEAVVPFELDILHMDAHLVVVDKPHFLASTPGGRYLQETALTRLRKQLDLPELSPIHRLDRETAGVMLFCVDAASRGAYQTLFQHRQVTKEYEAIAPWREDLIFPLVHRSCLQDCASSFTVQEVDGEPNSETRIEVVERLGPLAHYRLMPSTGRKHQLRAHLSALGIPICDDLFYPRLRTRHDVDDYDRPLQLLARAIEFTDPFSGKKRRFESRRLLAQARCVASEPTK